MNVWLKQWPKTIFVETLDHHCVGFPGPSSPSHSGGQVDGLLSWKHQTPANDRPEESQAFCITCIVYVSSPVSVLVLFSVAEAPSYFLKKKKNLKFCFILFSVSWDFCAFWMRPAAFLMQCRQRKWEIYLKLNTQATFQKHTWVPGRAWELVSSGLLSVFLEN